MQIEDGRFYFVNDDFMDKYGEKYIEHKYTINKTDDVTVFEETKIKVLHSARTLLRLTREKNIRIAFGDILQFKQELLSE